MASVDDLTPGDRIQVSGIMSEGTRVGPHDNPTYSAGDRADVSGEFVSAELRDNNHRVVNVIDSDGQRYSLIVHVNEYIEIMD